MKGIIVRRLTLAGALLLAAGMAHADEGHGGMNHQGMNHQGMNHQGMNHQGMNHGGGHWTAPAEYQTLANPIAKTADSIARGKQLFSQNCASCHGPFGEGDGPAGQGLTPPPTNLRAMADHHPDGDFFWKIANGRGAMPAWKGVLSDEDIWHLVNYIKSLPYTAPQKPTQFDLNHGHALQEGHH